MIHIAICDDDKHAVIAHKQIVQNCLAQNKSAGEIAVYTDSGNRSEERRVGKECRL